MQSSTLSLARFAFLFAVAACASLPELEDGTCGNGVLDLGEDCDRKSAECGGVGTAQACRFVCTTEIECPTGFGCGSDGICRTGTGAFARAPVAAVAADRMLAADWYGTSQRVVLAVSRDVLDLGRPRMLVFDRSGALTSNDALEGSFGLGHVADADGDGLDDVVFTRLDGLLLSLGGGSSLVPVPSDAISLPAGARARLATVRGTSARSPQSDQTAELLALVSNVSVPHAPALDHTYVIGRDLARGVIAELEIPLRALTPRTSTLPDPKYLCERLVLAHLGEHAIDTLQACCALDDTSCRGRLRDDGAGRIDRVAVTSGRIAGGPWSVDVDGDGRTDVVVVTELEDGAQRLEIAFGGSHIVELDDASSRVLYGDPPAAGPEARPGATTVLALLDRGQRLHSLGAVLDVGIESREVRTVDEQNRETTISRRFLTLVSSAQVGYVSYDDSVETGEGTREGPWFDGLLRASTWTSARLAKLSGGDVLDVVGGQMRSIDLDLALGTEGFGLNSVLVRTGLSTSHLEIADVDGDRTQDVVFASNLGPTSRLSVLFGRGSGLPSEILSIGEFERIEQVVGGSLALGFLGDDSAADLALVTRGEAGDSIALLRSVGGRLPFPIYELESDQDGSSDATLGSVIARHDGGADLVALGLDLVNGGGGRVWSGQVQTEGGRTRLTRPTPGETFDVAPLVSQADLGVNLAMTAADLDGDGTDEVIGVTSSGDGARAVLFSLQRGAQGYDLALAPTAIAPLTIELPRVFAAEWADADGDGDLDLFVLLASPPRELDELVGELFDLSRRDTAVVLVRNEGGSLQVDQAVTLTVPDKPLAITSGSLGGGGARELVVVTAEAVYVRRGGSFVEIFAQDSAGGRLLADTRSVLLADVTGDGVADLVLGGRERLTVLRAETSNP